MNALHRIIVGHSLLPDGDVALRSATVLAERAEAALCILHVVEPYPLYEKIRFPSIPAAVMLEEVTLKVRAQLTDLARISPLSHLHVETDARVGKPFLELLRTACTWDANLVVVGVSSRGEGRFLGSTGERVLQKAMVPVLLVKRELTVGPKTVLVPIDFSPCSRKAAEEGVAVVRGFGGKVIFLHVMDFRYIYPAAYGVEPIFIPPVTPAELEPEWQEFLRGLPLNGVSWEKQTREGRAAPTIADAAWETGADLVAIGTHGRTGPAHVLLGSVAGAVLRLTPCSVLTVRPEAFRFELP